MRIQVHDFGGYAFAADLSVHLAGLGHEVEHVFCAQYSANVGDFSRRERPGLTFTALTADAPAEKYSLAGRARFELAYGRAWRIHTEATDPDLVVCANVPLLPLGAVRRWSAAKRRPWVLWHQDVVSIAMGDELRRRFPSVVGRFGAGLLDRLERRAVRSAAGIAVISDGFAPVYSRWRIAPAEYTVVRNWAPLAEVRPQSRSNAWSAAVLGPDELPRLVYAGTIGRKHRPHLLTDLARVLSDADCPVHLVVVSEGPAAEALRDARVGGSRVSVLPFQPADRLAEVLASGDVLVALLEPAAAAFSVPSKVATYLAAGRPILGLMPRHNAAAADITRVGGLVAEPDDGGVALAAGWLRTALASPEELEVLGRRARSFAEDEFSPETAVRTLTDLVLAAGSRRVAG